MSVERINRVKDLLLSTSEIKVRVKDLSTGDVVIHSMCNGPMYVDRRKNKIILYRIYQKLQGAEIRWKSDGMLSFGLNCQMWIKKKVSSRAKK